RRRLRPRAPSLPDRHRGRPARRAARHPAPPGGRRAAHRPRPILNPFPTQNGAFRMKTIVLSSLAAALMGAASLAQAATTLTVYTDLEADQLKAYLAACEKENPDIKIQWVRDSTGIITAKLLAEKNSPMADAIWGLAGSSLGLMASQGMLQPYAPKGLDRIDAKMRDQGNPPSGVGMAAYHAP